LTKGSNGECFDLRWGEGEGQLKARWIKDLETVSGVGCVQRSGSGFVEGVNGHKGRGGSASWSKLDSKTAAKAGAGRRWVRIRSIQKKLDMGDQTLSQ